MTCLPDVNVWIALVVAEHVGHEAASAWYRGSEWDLLVFSRVTQMGFLRLLTNRHVVGRQALDLKGAWEMLDQIRQDKNIRFARETAGIEEKWRSLCTEGALGSNAWTDAYLAAFAEVSGFTIVTFDRGFARFRNAPVRRLA